MPPVRVGVVWEAYMGARLTVSAALMAVAFAAPNPGDGQAGKVYWVGALVPPVISLA